MARDSKPKPAPDINAAWILKKATSAKTVAFSDSEAAWMAWASHIQDVDERGMTLLKAAFEAGWEAKRQS